MSAENALFLFHFFCKVNEINLNCSTGKCNELKETSCFTSHWFELLHFTCAKVKANFVFMHHNLIHRINFSDNIFQPT